ncbi:3-deoxy-8-phosphooctulonate synthase [Helicobacter sp. 13S00482-2]|uniref:3-deoxy-8-phosphooctulonate synthase n=1 Tax=Helicobacter sp. 13S00482-2 TaxID=1476200 RepID=UPI000BA7092E|nr:3-deoxy-8-phosphooctulonate synthase [Helicobacter sp. 13S00482-2]PAF53646.1 3-deoxy-8-phosphooctulonate synthase [Helicobacter sp. 13S00482-2]
MTKMILLSGPCVIESYENLHTVAKGMKSIAQNPKIDFYFKASFDKANRTSLESYRGPGLEAGMEMLAQIKKEFGYKIITDIHESYQAQSIAKVADVIQIPAFLCRQTDLIVEVAKTNSIVNIKKGQFMNPEDMKYSVLKAIKTRGGNSAEYSQAQKYGVWLCERGSSFGYGNLVVDMRSLVIMRKFAPVIFDATHSVQMPGGAGGKSGGDSSFVPYLAKAAAAVGVDGFFMETHPSPKDALSDGPNMVCLNDLGDLVEKILDIQGVLK